MVSQWFSDGKRSVSADTLAATAAASAAAAVAAARKSGRRVAPLCQVIFLQDMPTKEWGEEEVEPLLSQAYILSTLFERSPNHLGAS